MLILSKGVKWLAVAGIASYLAAPPTIPQALQGVARQTFASEAGNVQPPFTAVGIGEIMARISR